MTAAILRSLGDSRTPVVWLVIASIINIILDIVFIVAFKWDVFGAAIATVIAQFVSGFGCLFKVCRDFPVLKMDKDDWKPSGKNIGMLLAMGLPMGLQYSITAIGSSYDHGDTCQPPDRPASSIFVSKSLNFCVSFRTSKFSHCSSRSLSS